MHYKIIKKYEYQNVFNQHTKIKTIKITSTFYNISTKQKEEQKYIIEDI